MCCGSCCGFVTSGPDHTLIVSGWGFSKPRYIIGGGSAWVVPCLQRADFLPMNVFQISIISPEVPTSNGAKITVRGTAQVKINNDPEYLKHAAQHFLGKDIEEIQDISLETLEGHQRSIMGKMTIEEILQNKQKFGIEVFEIAQVDLIKMGLIIISYTLKELSDQNGYLEAYGAGAISAVKCEERIKVAEARTRAEISDFKAKEEKEKSRLKNAIEIAENKRDYELRKAANDQDIYRVKAIEDSAEKIRTAEKMVEIVEQKMKVKVIELERQITIQEQEVLRREKELDAKVKKPAEAEKYKMIVEANAQYEKQIMEAEAEAEGKRLLGESMAFANEARATAEAENMKRRAAALNSYRGAAMTQMMIEKLPQIIHEISQPMIECENVNLVSSGGSQLGASMIADEVLKILNTLPQTVKNLTGVDIVSEEHRKLIGNSSEENNHREY